ncbi:MULTISPECIES: glycosyltransferase [Providencia]|uniref:glycosyltransferase n=1 Tax=Providencia TaxID=586 RepID=UPI000D85AAD2|nr:glycosyltransferase [Providencia rettgeri]MCG5281877.1 glycosyltransferase [Providencia rettgeri]PYZ60599.1 hypothetical protein DNK63_16420 [Providencia rettgeri]
MPSGKKNLILFLSDISDKGGIQRVLENLSNKLIDNYNITILSVFYSGAYDNIYTAYEFNKKIKIIGLIEKNTIHSRLIKIFRIFSVLNKIKKITKKNKTNVFIANGMECVTYSILPLLSKYKYIAYDHTSFDRKSLPIIIGRLLSRLFANKIIVLTELDKLKWKTDKATIIYNATPHPLRNYNSILDRPKNITAIGRFTEIKGFERLLDIWSIVENENRTNGYKLLLVGDGPLKNKLQKKINSLKLNYVEILPFKETIEDIYENTRLFLGTSFHEGSSMVLIEAIQYDIPAIVFDTSGYAEQIINKKNGFIINQGDIMKFSKKVIEILNDDSKLLYLSKNCSLTKDKFNYSNNIKRMEALINELHP